MTDLELAEEIERHLAPDAIYWHWEPSMADMEQIIAALRRGPERIAELEKDAGRYEWMKVNAVHVLTDAYHIYLTIPCAPSLETLEQVIDAALKSRA